MTKDLPQLVQPPSDGKHRTAKARKEIPKILDSGWQKETTPNGSHAFFKHDMKKKDKGKGERDRTNSLSR